MFAKFNRTFHTTQNYPTHFEEVGENSFGVGFATGNRILNIKILKTRIK